MRHIEEIVQRQINRWNNITQLLHYAPGQAVALAKQPEEAQKTPYPVVCISREIGAGAREIAGGICRRLGYEFYGSKLIDEIAKDMKVQRWLVDSLDEWGRGELEFMLETFLRGHEIEIQEYLRSLVRVVKTMALKGGVVLLGRGAPFILRDQSALNIRVVAPLEVRIRRLMEYSHLEEKEARRRAVESDHQREGFARRFFKQNIDDSVNFDLTINTGRIRPEDGLGLILSALEMRGYNLDQITIPLPATAQ